MTVPTSGGTEQFPYVKLKSLNIGRSISTPFSVSGWVYSPKRGSSSKTRELSSKVMDMREWTWMKAKALERWTEEERLGSQHGKWWSTWMEESSRGSTCWYPVQKLSSGFSSILFQLACISQYFFPRSEFEDETILAGFPFNALFTTLRHPTFLKLLTPE